MNTDKSSFAFFPLERCPFFDDSEILMVEEWRGFKVGMQVGFCKSSTSTIHGEIVAIGENAKYFNGEVFIAFAVRIGKGIYFATHKEIHHIV